MPPVSHVRSLLGEILKRDDGFVEGSAVIKTLAARTTTTATLNDPGQGSVDPTKINNKGLLGLFALLGAALVLAAIWFFFWAKNGGFIWRKGDWEDYKSTVLRRKGPDGRTLSNATKSTRLGGGSVVGKGYSDDGYTYTDSLSYTETATTLTEKTEKTDRKRRRKLKETAKQKLLRRRKDERWEGEADDDVRAYRQEKPARVGGMNAEGDGTYHGSSYDTSNPPTQYTGSEMSEVHDYAYEPAPAHTVDTNTHRGGNERHRSHRRQQDSRTVSTFSFTPGNDDVLSQPAEDDRRQRDEDRAARRRERRRERERERESRHAAAAAAAAGPPPSTSSPSSRQSSPRKQARRSRYTEPLDFSSAGTRSEYQYSNVETDDDTTGTKSYHHPIPGLSKGYRRDGGGRRRDSLSESD